MNINDEALLDNASVLKIQDEDILDQFNAWVDTIPTLNSHPIKSNIVSRIIKDVNDQKQQGMIPGLTVPQTGHTQFVEYHKYSKYSKGGS